MNNGKQYIYLALILGIIFIVSNSGQKMANTTTIMVYQETADLYDYSQPEYITIEYNKPSNLSSNNVWQVKHANFGTYNVSIPESCLNYDAVKLSFKIVADAMFSTINSQLYCYDGSWQKIGQEYSAYCNSASLGNYNSAPNAFDGNWDTAAAYNTGGWPHDNTRWINNYNCYTTGGTTTLFYEEAMWWNVNTLLCDNTADIDADCTISLSEVITFATSWVNNEGVTLTEVINAAIIWVDGGSY